MKEYLEKILHKNIYEYSYGAKENLPLACKNAFELSVMQMGECEFILAAPIEDMNLTELRKSRIQIERYTGYMCAFYLKRVNWYAVSKMIEEGIPFVWEGNQIYLPFLGILLQKNVQRVPGSCVRISFLAQKLLLTALYDNWQNVSAAKAAELLKVSRMSITRCYDEIEALGMPFLKRQNRSRRFYAIESRKEMWNVMLPFLRNPVIREFRLGKAPEEAFRFSGTSALAEYSLLSSGACVTYAVTKDQIGEAGVKAIREVPYNEEPECIIQEVGYELPYGDNTAIDPLSVVLAISEEEVKDPRIEICINEMLEEYVW